jgi:hypothetical protein
MMPQSGLMIRVSYRVTLTRHSVLTVIVRLEVYVWKVIPEGMVHPDSRRLCS